MQPYRIYFRHRKDGIVGRDDFEAEDDRSGMAIAAVLCDACGDVCDSHEPWQGVRRVNVRCDDAGARAGRRRFDMKVQEAAAKREEWLRESDWAIARSRRLLRRLRHQLQT